MQSKLEQHLKDQLGKSLKSGQTGELTWQNLDHDGVINNKGLHAFGTLMLRQDNGLAELRNHNNEDFTISGLPSCPSETDIYTAILEYYKKLGFNLKEQDRDWLILVHETRKELLINVSTSPSPNGGLVSVNVVEY